MELAENARKHNLKIIVLRNYEGLPKINKGNDIDIIINKKDLSKWVKILEVIALNNQLKFKKIKKYSYCLKTVVEGVEDKNNKLELDLNYDLNWRGVEFIKTVEVEERADIEVENIIFTAPLSIAYFVTLCHSFLYGGHIKSKYAISLDVIRKSDNLLSDFMNRMNFVFGEDNAKKLLAMHENNNPQQNKKQIRSIRVAVLLKGFRRNPLKFVIGFIKSYLYDVFG